MTWSTSDALASSPVESHALASSPVESHSVTEDMDVFRAPRKLHSYTAASLWSLLGNPDDPAALLPQGEAKANAVMYGSLTATDSHAANLLLSKHLISVLPHNHFHLPSLCMQHRTGSVCEEVSKKWGLLPCSFCLASQLVNNSFRENLRTSVRVVLAKYLDVVPLASSPVEASSPNQASSPVEASSPNQAFSPVEASRKRLSKFATELLHICHVVQHSDNANRSDHEERREHAKRQTEADEFL
eukprot:3472992-Karenia_brevis.AAC.1